VVDLVVGTFDGYRRHRTSRNAAVVAYFGFLSVFPLMIVFTTILGLVLQDRPDWQETIIDSALTNLPFVGQQLAVDPGGLSGSPAVIVLGVLTTLWAGMRAFVAIHQGLDDTAELDIDLRVSGVVVRLHAIVAIVIVGLAQVASAVLSSLFTTDVLPTSGRWVLLVASLAVNTAVLLFCYQWLCTERRPVRRIWVGALLAGVAFTVLQTLGTAIIGRAIANASPVYGSFASVIALVAYMGLHANAAFFADEFNRYRDHTPRAPRSGRRAVEA
jgi:uncharacterized BrkB/YihY/UPF0761 family membrane protein